MFTLTYSSPIGPLLLQFDDNAVTGLYFSDISGESGLVGSSSAAEQCIKELDEYFSGARKTFTVPVNLKGTGFRKAVWAQLLQIPYGETASYKEIASSINNPKAVRAVGGANHNNPISIIVPCHRVIGSNGGLTGYGGELWRKEWLLAHERKYANR